MIKINKEFLASALPVVKNCKKLGRDYMAGVFVEDSESERRFYTTDGHNLLVFKEPIQNKEFSSPFRIVFDALPKIKKSCDSFLFEVISEGRGLLSADSSVAVEIVADSSVSERLEGIKKLVSDEKIKSLQPVKDYIVFSDEVIKINKKYMGDSEYMKRPFSECYPGDGQSGAAVYWVSENKVSVCMPMRLIER